MDSEIYSEVNKGNSDSESVSFSSECTKSLSTIMNESNQKIIENENRLQTSVDIRKDDE